MDTTSTTNNQSPSGHGKRGCPVSARDKAIKKQKQKRSRRRASRLSKIDRWTLKAVSELRRFSTWIQSQTHEDALLLPPYAAPISTSTHSTSTPLEQGEGPFRVFLSVDPLPEVHDIVKRERLETEEATDVSSYESDGCLLWINFRLAERLVSTRKSVRLPLTNGAWPAKELLINPAVANALQDRRYSQLCQDLISRILIVCREVSKGVVIVCCRLGLDVAADERSLIVCATGVSADDAKQTARNVWKRCLKLCFDSDVG